MLSGAIWRKGVSQRRRAPLAGFPTWGRYRRLAGAALVFLYGDDLTSLDNSSMAAPQRLDHAHARDAHGRQITSEQHRAAMPQATPSMLGVVACRRTMSSSTSNGALLLPHVVFTTKSIDEMRTFGTRSLPVTWDGLGTRYRALGDVLREASSCRSSSTRSRGRGFCPDPSDRLRPQDFRPSVTSRTAGKARARRLAIAVQSVFLHQNFEKYS